MRTYVIGHKNPDTDSVVSAIALAFLRDCSPAVSGKINKETDFLLKKFGFELPPLLPDGEKRIILVDNNGNPEELAPGIEPTEIVEVVDHHKLGGLKIAEPIPVTIKTLGSTATIIFNLYQESSKKISKEMAGLMLGAIVSDTLKFTSPTTTRDDIKAAETLSEMASVNIDDLASEMFAAKSDISDVPTPELLRKDYKVFDMTGNKVGIGVWETTLPEAVISRKKEIMQSLEDIKKTDGLDFVLFGVVDILDTKTHLMLLGEPELQLIEKAFGAKAVEGVAALPGVVSRKKQLVPTLERALS
jgi:manganese-dependent inorganic pyrophosphatase